ncbi:T6SS immunity protein Tli4 family protein [Massilia sp. IC2-476]|uniref:T6SS immunity protein Tli4 family protein n=1 Tax=Massilia sp. IC2-476 TaxID=2887199 RepID=UPI001D0FBF84|nr:T6SS immunity protein Tli4 family protein [Massilia sp. IC2-476]MCC2970952.1 hypothetical protein [Massilia sp. IC2-476]
MMKFILALSFTVLLGCKPSGNEGKKMYIGNDMVHCVGRHFVSIPISFQPSNITTGIFKAEGATAQDPEIDILVQSGITTKTKFDIEVQKRRSELSRSESKAVDVLKMDTVLPDGSTLFRVQEIDDAYFSEMFFLRGNAMVKLRLDSFNNAYLEAEEQLKKLSKSITSLDVSSVGPGFCLGPVVIQSNLSQENGKFTYRDNGGLVLEIGVDTFSHNDPMTLSDRMKRDSSALQELKVRTKVLRARQRTTAGMLTDEWLGIGHIEGAGEHVLKFMLETRRKNPGKTTPSISLSLDSGQPLSDGTRTTTQIENDQAVAMWDHIVESIKLAKQEKH